MSLGKTVRLLERARGVGGRCATRRVDGQAVDHGLVFLHGDAPDFISALHEVPSAGSLDWPRTILGSGTPCQPRAYVSGGVRIAYSQGVSAFPKHLARWLAVELETDAIGVEATPAGVRVMVRQQGEQAAFEAKDLVLAVAGPQALRLLNNPIFAEAGRASRAILEMLPSVACATVIALYDTQRIEAPRWDIWYPETSQKLLLMSHDSVKRLTPERLALVLQARPAWSAEVASDDPQQWARELLDEGARLAGPWVRSPSVVHEHFWHHARTNPDSELSGPMLFRLPNGARVGIPGEICAPGGGVQAAWQSGRALATQLCEEARI